MTHRSTPLLAGVDGTREGWIAAIGSYQSPSRLECLQTLEALLEQDFQLIIIDIPIGLPSAPARGCDVEARRKIGDRRSSVFPAPCREMLGAPDQPAASRIREELDGRGCSKQLFAILKKIDEADRLITLHLQRRVCEGHPEFSFTEMNRGRPMSFYKGRAEGARERVGLLLWEFPDIETRLATLARSSLRIDAIDAYALLWSARRVMSGTAVTIPTPPEYDAHDLRAEIVA